MGRWLSISVQRSTATHITWESEVQNGQETVHLYHTVRQWDSNDTWKPTWPFPDLFRSLHWTGKKPVELLSAFALWRMRPISSAKKRVTRASSDVPRMKHSGVCGMGTLVWRGRMINNPTLTATEAVGRTCRDWVVMMGTAVVGVRGRRKYGWLIFLVLNAFPPVST